MEEIDPIKEKETLTFSEVYNQIFQELSEKFAEKIAEKFSMWPIPDILKNSLVNNFRKSILAADEKINQTYSMNKTVIDFIMKQNFTKLRLELIEFDAAFRMNTLQNRSARLEFACSFDDEKEKYLLMDVQKEILLTNTTSGLFNFKNEFANSLQPKFDDYVYENYSQLGSKNENTKIISINKTDFKDLVSELGSSDEIKIIFYPMIIKDRDIPLYRSIGKDVTRYKDQFSLFMIGENSTGLIPPNAYDTFCLNPPDKC